jgi:8-oxo-dGTP diphosphatase
MREDVAALIVQQQMILLGKRSADRAFYPNVWDVFGGHVEPDESYEQALQRELYEELGITPIRWEYLTTLAEPDPDQYGPGQYRFYLVTAWSGTPRNQQPHEHARIQWFALDQAKHLELAHPAYAGLFADALSRFVKEGSGHRLVVLFDGT